MHRWGKKYRNFFPLLHKAYPPSLLIHGAASFRQRSAHPRRSDTHVNLPTTIHFEGWCNSEASCLSHIPLSRRFPALTTSPSNLPYPTYGIIHNVEYSGPIVLRRGVNYDRSARSNYLCLLLLPPTLTVLFPYPIYHASNFGTRYSKFCKLFATVLYRLINHIIIIIIIIHKPHTRLHSAQPSQKWITTTVFN